jgi:glucuronate isomerase
MAGGGATKGNSAMTFINENFLLQTRTARRLYRSWAAAEPILDFHCHLSAREIAENRRFENLQEIWLEGDHYKWRAMRANGVDERFCTGDASPYEKLLAWARTVPRTLRNPLHHWTHLELLRYFGIRELLDEGSTPKIWARANQRLKSEALSVQGILKKFRVVALCTTDDPADSLEFHERIRRSRLETKVFPAFRPDRALGIDGPAAFNEWTDRLGAAANVDISSFARFLDALRKRHDEFHALGCRLSDHGLKHCYADFCSEEEAQSIFETLRSEREISASETAAFASFMMLFFGRLDAEKGWTKQLHIGALRNVNGRMLEQLGRDTGFDSMSDEPQAERLAAFLDRLNRENALPRMIVYNLNPANYYAFATVIGSFQGDGIAGKMQLGSGWWFLDQKEGIEWQLNALSNCGLLSRFVGMVTDSRSYMSYPRHEYFRRVLCNLLGAEMENGLLPKDEKLVGSIIRDICYDNAAAHFRFPSVEPRHGAGVPAKRKVTSRRRRTRRR